MQFIRKHLGDLATEHDVTYTPKGKPGELPKSEVVVKAGTKIVDMTPEQIYQVSKEIHTALNSQAKAGEAVHTGREREGRPTIFHKPSPQRGVRTITPSGVDVKPNERIGKAGAVKSEGAINQMQDAVNAALRKAGYKGEDVQVVNLNKIPKELQRLTKSLKELGGYRTGDGKIVLNAIPHDSIADAMFTAFHELFHRGELGVEAKPYLDALQAAKTNRVVGDIVRAIEAKTAHTGSESISEALADIGAAKKTGDWARLQAKYGVKMDAFSKASASSALQKFIGKATEFFKRLLGGVGKRRMTNEEVHALVDHVYSQQNKKITSLGETRASLKPGEFDEPTLKKEEKVPAVPKSTRLVTENSSFAKKLIDKARRDRESGKLTFKQYAAKVRGIKAKYSESPEMSNAQQKRVNDLIDILQKQREPASKLRQSAQAYTYFNLLHSFSSVFRIVGTSTSELVFNPLSEAIGSALAKSFKGLGLTTLQKINETASRYRGGDVGLATKEYLGKIGRNVTSEVGNILKTGHTSIEQNVRDFAVQQLRAGTIKPELLDMGSLVSHAYDISSQGNLNLLNAPGRTHGVLHSAPFVAEYNFSLQKRTNALVEDLVKGGMSKEEAQVASMHPVNQVNMQLAALSDGLERAYRGKTAVTEATNKTLARWEKQGGLGKALAILIKDVFNPFLTVSANLFDRAQGGLFGAIRAWWHYEKTLGSKEDLSPIAARKAADFIMKQIRAQGMGAGALLIGGLFWKQFGGLYQSGGDYFRKDKPHEGSLQLTKDITTPQHLMEHPYLQIANLGAMTWRAFMENHGSFDKAAKSAASGVGSMADLLSLVGSAGQLEKIFTDKQGISTGFMKYMNELAYSRLVPGSSAIRTWANVQDLVENQHISPLAAIWAYSAGGESVYRMKKTATQQIEANIPKTPLSKNFNRQLVPRG